MPQTPPLHALLQQSDAVEQEIPFGRHAEPGPQTPPLHWPVQHCDALVQEFPSGRHEVPPHAELHACSRHWKTFVYAFAHAGAPALHDAMHEQGQLVIEQLQFEHVSEHADELLS